MENIIRIGFGLNHLATLPIIPFTNRISVWQVNQTHYFLAGGRDQNDNGQRDAFLFDWTANTWTSLPNLNSTIDSLILNCVLYDDATQGQLVLATGREPVISSC